MMFFFQALCSLFNLFLSLKSWLLKATSRWYCLHFIYLYFIFIYILLYLFYLVVNHFVTLLRNVLNELSLLLLLLVVLLLHVDIKNHIICFYRASSGSMHRVKKDPTVSVQRWWTPTSRAAVSHCVHYNRAVYGLPAEHILINVVCLIILQLVTVSSHTS